MHSCTGNKDKGLSIGGAIGNLFAFSSLPSLSSSSFLFLPFNKKEGSIDLIQTTTFTLSISTYNFSHSYYDAFNKCAKD